MNEDRKLKELGYFFGTERYHRISTFKSVVSDGIIYIMENGYSWFITDVLAVIEYGDDKLNQQEFLSIQLKLDDNKAKMIITDGNDTELYVQEYNFTDAEVELNLYWRDNVLILSREN